MSYSNWLSAYYVSKFINTSRNPANRPIPLAMGSSIMIRQLALDRAFRREVLRERRRALREARNGGLWESWMLSTRVAAESSGLVDYGEEDWLTDEEEEEGESVVDSALLRESRLREMKQLPKCYDREMAERYRTIKQVTLRFVR